MNDLNTPLGQKLKPRSTPKKAGNSRRASAVFAILGLLLAGAANAALLYADRDRARSIVVSLPQDNPDITVAGITPASQMPNNETGVTVLYGNETGPQETILDDGTIVETPFVFMPEEDEAPAISLPLPVDRQPQPQNSRSGPKIIVLPQSSAADVGQPSQVAHLPEDSALEETASGVLPRRTDDGRRPMDIYARPYSTGAGKRIAIVIGGLGISELGTQNAINALPPEITLAFAPASDDLERWMRIARRKGHELLVQVPMEPFNFPQNNPGPNTLRLASTGETNIERLHWAMGKMTNYTGISNYLGARFMTDEAALAPVLTEVASRGLLFFNDGSTKNATIAESARLRDVPYAQADLVIDVSQSIGDITARLEALEQLAELRGTAIGSGSALEMTVETVARWANDAKKRGYEIVGIAALAE